jgi:hypothetical protein
MWKTCIGARSCGDVWLVIWYEWSAFLTTPSCAKAIWLFVKTIRKPLIFCMNLYLRVFCLQHVYWFYWLFMMFIFLKKSWLILLVTLACKRVCEGLPKCQVHVPFHGRYFFSKFLAVWKIFLPCLDWKIFQDITVNILCCIVISLSLKWYCLSLCAAIDQTFAFHFVALLFRCRHF